MCDKRIIMRFNNLDPKRMGPSEMNSALSGLANVSRGLVLDGDLSRNRTRNLWNYQPVGQASKR